MGRLSIQFGDREPENAGDNLVRMRGAEFRFGLTHLAEEQTVALLEAHRNFADLQIEHDLVRIAMLPQVPGGPQRGMSGKRQLFIYREDADLVAFPLLDGRRRAAG